MLTIYFIDIGMNCHILCAVSGGLKEETSTARLLAACIVLYNVNYEGIIAECPQ